MVDQDQIKGKVTKAKGTVREAIGKATGNEQQVAKGQVEQAQGAVQEMVGDTRNALKDLADKAKRTAEALVGAVKPEPRAKP